MLVPGDSPIYFSFIIKILHPEIMIDTKITIVEFPISGVGNKMYLNPVDGYPYFENLLEKVIGVTKLNQDHNFLIMDYYESGDSVEYIKYMIKKIYTDKSYYKDSISIQFTDLDINRYFLYDSEIEIEDIEKYFTKKRNIIALENGKRSWNDVRENVRKFNLPPRMPDNFPEEYPDKLKQYKFKLGLLKYFVDDSDRRCQYKLPIKLANDYAESSKTNDITIKSFYDSVSKSPFNYKICNTLLLLFYIYIRFNTQLKQETTSIINIIKNKLVK
jgi:hypothetical protein